MFWNLRDLYQSLLYSNIPRVPHKNVLIPSRPSLTLPVFLQHLIGVLGARGLSEERLHLSLKLCLPGPLLPSVPVREVSLQQRGAQTDAASQ